jgi:Tol biopolymer transport system component
MGEVYRARDTRLDRLVAIKVLPPDVAADPERRGRLQREAKAVSSLNHPHICTLHDVGVHGDTHYLVMELIAGETLATRLARVRAGGGLPLAEALQIGHEVALALEAAHRQNIVHRDLKPANVMLTKTGVKLLDFGLAKLTALDHLPGQKSIASTASLLTNAGAIVGTLSYMAPEQLEGKPVDGRSDIFAFGALMYEVLTGARAFDGASTASVIASILGHEPPAVSHSQPLATPALDRLVSKCLAKSPDARWQSATDLADELRWIISSKVVGAPTATGGTASPRRPAVAAFVVGALLAGALAGAAMWRWLSPAATGSPGPLVRFTIQPPVAAPLNLDTIWRSVAIAAGGSRFAYSAGGNSSGGQLMVRDFSEPVARAVVGAPVVRDPFMSPDGQWVGFHGAGLQKIPVGGGSPVTIVNAGAGSSLRGAGPGTPRGSSWGDDDQIVFATSDPTTGLFRVAAAGGEPVKLTTPDVAGKEGDHVFPSVLPGARGVLFTVRGGDGAPSRVAVLDYATASYRPIVSDASNATYVDSGHIVYESAGALRVAPFDLGSLTVTGESRLLMERVVVTPDGAANYGISRAGALVAVASRPSTPRSLVWVDRATGVATPVAGMPKRPYVSPRVSPDQRRIAVAIEDEGEDIWLWDIVSSTLTQVTTHAGRDTQPVFTPDGNSILFSSSRDGRFGMYTRSISGTSGDRRLETGSRVRPIPSAVTPDGLRVLYHAADPATTWDLMDVAIDSATPPRVLLATADSENFGVVSPDGRHIAYSHTVAGVTSAMPVESGTQVFVQPYPGINDGRWQVSNGRAPLWSRDGRELIFVDGAVLKSVAVSGEGRPVGSARVHFDASPYLITEGGGFDVSADGKRVLMVARETTVEPSTLSAQIIVTLNALNAQAGSARQ